MCWIYLFLAIVFEVLGTLMMKMSNGLTEFWPSAGMFAAYVICFAVLSLSLKEIEVSVAYAIWSALGITLISIIGVVFFHEHINIYKTASILLIVMGVIGLKLASA